jgi:hypothetical protein
VEYARQMVRPLPSLGAAYLKYREGTKSSAVPLLRLICTGPLIEYVIRCSQALNGPPRVLRHVS